MRLNAPTKKVFWASVVLAVLGIVAKYVVTTIPFVSEYAILVVLLGYILLAAGNYFKNF